MAPVQSSCRRECLARGAKDHCKNDIEGPMKTANRVRQCSRMLGDRGGDPGMCELKQQRAARPKENRRFPVDPPHDGVRPKHTGAVARRIADAGQSAFEIGCRDDFQQFGCPSPSGLRVVPHSSS